jgi:hypothetical protein
MKFAAKWLGLAVLGMAIVPVGSARAGLVLQSAILTGGNGGTLQGDPAYMNGAFGEPIGSSNAFGQTSSGPTSVTLPSNGQTYTDGFVMLTGQVAGSASLSPSAASFDSLSFGLSSSTGLSNPSLSGIAASESSGVSYNGSFIPTSTGNYLLTMSASSTTAFNVTGSSQTGFMLAEVTLNEANGSQNYSLLSQAQANSLVGGTFTFSEVVTLFAGETYQFRGEAESSSEIDNNVPNTAQGTITGSSSVDFSLTPSVVPEPASIVQVGIASLIGLGVAWRRRWRRVKAA